ncbi:hypothetical protein F5Y05DRAFT_398325 [Hypoxylon sp. FL0543]|nr:hypothetical protein F5Y05DRAFT_398325 [Hypoxylon sp. FL0543]
MADSKGTSYSTDPALYLYTSLTAGSSHIVTATSRLETILRANRVPFKAIDIATDEKARMLWGRRAGKDESGRLRKLPGLVQMGLVLGDLVEIEEWNEYGELKQHVTIYYDDFTIPPKSQAPPPAQAPKPKPAATTTPASKPGASTPAAHPPAAPPLPEKSKAADAAPKKAAAAAASAASAAAAPVRSIAEEAAAKAKQVHLESLRAKVYGKKDGKAASGSSSSKSATPKEEAPEVKAKAKAKGEDADSAAEGLKGLSIKEKAAGEAGLQSPTTGTWRAGVPSEEALRPVLQSPTSGTWKVDGSGDVKEFRGAEIENASAEEIAAIEKAEAIPEATSSEEEDSEEEEEEDDEEEESSEEEGKAKKK